MLKGPWEGTDSAARKSLGRTVHGQLFAGTEAYLESYLLFWSACSIAISVSGCLDSVDGCLKDPQRNNILSNFSADVKGMPTLHSRHCL